MMCARTVYPGARARHLVKEQGYVAAGIEMLRNRGRRDLRQLATASLQAAIAPVIKTRQHRMRCRCGRPPGPVAGHCRHRPGPGRAVLR